MFFEAPMLGRSNARQPQQIKLSEASAGKVLAPAEERFGSDVLAILEQHYPTHFWRVEVDFSQQLGWFYIPILMGPTAKYFLHLNLITSVNDLRNEVVKGGGEILERFGIPRAGLDFGLAQFLDARANKRLTRPFQDMPT